MMKLLSRSNKRAGKENTINGATASNSVPRRIKLPLAGSSNNDLDVVSSNGDSLLSSEAMAQLEEMRGAMTTMQSQMQIQNEETFKQNYQMQRMMSAQSKQMNRIMTAVDHTSFVDMSRIEEEKNLPIDCGSYEIEWDQTTWSVTGVSSKFPDADHDYFPGLQGRRDNTSTKNDDDDLATTYSIQNRTPDKVISAIIPCYNEEGKELERTIRGLSRQIMSPGWKVELLIVLDGVTAMSTSMGDVLYKMFGVDFNSEDPSINPFLIIPDARTIIVQPAEIPSTEHNDGTSRRAVIEGCEGGFSLVVKRENRRKANSQQWWLGPFASKLNCQYALATDCGTYFERTTVLRLIERLDNDITTHAVTGTQRTMPANLQGDGNWELCYHPFHFLLRQLQRFEFEVDNVSFMNVYNSLGAMHVIPGPCGLYRYDKLGSLKEGLMHQYFQLFSRSNKGLILGNVELVEDRIPGTLLAFPPKKATKDENCMPVDGWPKTGLVHDAIFYMEAEKPLSQLVKQRRRWLNGTLATYVWMIQEGIISNSNQDPINKLLSWCLVVLGIFQGLVVRMFGPALLMVWMFRFGLFLPDLITDPSRIFDPSLSLMEVESESGRLLDGIVFGGMYLLLYIGFVLGHTPRAKPIQDEISIVRYTEPSRYKNDASSAYRGWLFHPMLWINFIVVVLYILNAIGIVLSLGWDGTPLTVRVLIAFCFLPFVAGLFDGLVRCNLSGLWGMVCSAPFACPLMIFHTIWLPAYATTRLSDLTWGNRERSSLDDETHSALRRAENGVKVAKFLIGFNTTVALIVIGLMQVYGNTFPIFVITYTLTLSATYVVSFLEILCRGFGIVENTSVTPTSSILVKHEDDEDDSVMNGDGEHDYYKQMEDKNVSKSSSSSPRSTIWCCPRSSDDSEVNVTTKTTESGILTAEASVELVTKSSINSSHHRNREEAPKTEVGAGTVIIHDESLEVMDDKYSGNHPSKELLLI